MLPVESPIAILISRAADLDLTAAERAAAMNVASRIASETGIALYPLDPPPGWAWRDGRVVPVEPSGIIPPLRSGGDRWDELSWKRRLFGDEPEPDNDNERATVPEPASASAVMEAIEPMPVPAVEPGRHPKTGPRPDSKVATIARLIRRSTGATAEELVEATGSTLQSLRVMVYMLRRDGEDIAYDRRAGRYFRAGAA